MVLTPQLFQTPFIDLLHLALGHREPLFPLLLLGE